MAPCDWGIDTACCPDWDTYDAGVQAAATTLATELLDRLTGYRYNQCPVTVRPCGKPCQGNGGSGAPWMIPFVDNGVWRNCGCTGGCTCRASCELVIGAPVASVTEVTIDGVELDSSAYRLDRTERGAVLVRIDGECFPECQDMDVAVTEVGSFTVTYIPGELLPADGAIYAGMLACQFAKACVGAGDCALPAQLQSLTRDGVSLEMVDPSTVPEAILTGIAEVDRWIRSVNPANLRQRIRIFSGDVRPHRVVS